MQEYGWFHWNDLRDMVWVVEKRATARQKQLFVCECVRRLWPLLQDVRSRTAVEVAELFVDHRASKQQLKAARRAAATAIAELGTEVQGQLCPSYTQQQLHEDEWRCMRGWTDTPGFRQPWQPRGLRTRVYSVVMCFSG